MIKVYKTFEISDGLWQQIADGFNECFEGHHETIDSLKNGYCVRNQWGYGYHAIDFDNETKEIRGFNTYTPSLYKDNVKILVSGSTFVKEKYRKDIFVYFDMAKALKKQGQEEGFVMSLGIPNQNSFQYSLKFLRASYIGNLDYYILPRNFSRCIRKPSISFFDCFSRVLSSCHVNLQLLTAKVFNSEEKDVKYSMVIDEEFYRARFGMPCYQKYVEGSFCAYFRLFDEAGINTAYLMDFRENGKRTKYALAKAVNIIIKRSHPDAILFVGFLRLKQNVLVKVPPKFVPKPLPLTCSILDKCDKEKFSDMVDVNNWNFSLMNFDVR